MDIKSKNEIKSSYLNYAVWVVHGDMHHLQERRHSGLPVQICCFTETNTSSVKKQSNKKIKQAREPAEQIVFNFIIEHWSFLFG